MSYVDWTLLVVFGVPLCGTAGVYWWKLFDTTVEWRKRPASPKTIDGRVASPSKSRPAASPLRDDSRYNAAVSAALRIVRLYDLAQPGASALEVSRLTFLLLDAMYEAERRPRRNDRIRVKASKHTLPLQLRRKDRHYADISA
jgi:hypothetical protein